MDRKLLYLQQILHPKKPKQWSLVESAIDADSTNIYTKVLQAARERLDYDMQTRLHGISSGDLVAVEARYHRTPACISTYVNKRSITACRKRADQVKSSRDANHAMITLIDEMKPDVDSGGVFLLTSLRDRYHDICDDMDIEERIASHTLKERLTKSWPDLSFIHQPGSSNLVCSGQITVADALRKAQSISNSLKMSKEEAEQHELTEKIEDYNLSDDTILHRAAGILRRNIAQCKRLEGEYFAYSEMTLDAEMEFVPPLLYQVLMWLTNRELYDDAVYAANMPQNAKCLHFACDIINMATNLTSPKHLGLAVQMHHDFGSRGIVDTLHSLGYCISYDELRCFLTSAAIHVQSMQVASPLATYIPLEIQPPGEDCHIVSGVGDNWDHNEHTPDGKRTTHAMTTLLLQPSKGTCELGRIKRVPECSLSTQICDSAGLTNVISFKNPTSRPEPLFPTLPNVEDIRPLINNDNVKQCESEEIIYNLVRGGMFHKDTGLESSKVPTWSAYHAILGPASKQPTSKVAYNPILMATPTDKSTIYTTLLRMNDLAAKLNQKFIPVTFDLGILSKALEVQWTRPEELSSVGLCEGGMHLMMAVFAAIGHIYGDAGLGQLLHESEAFLQPLLKEFREDGRLHPTFAFWDDLLHRVLLPLKLYIRSTRDGSWDVHQSAKSEFLPLLFAGNRTNYARYLPVMLLSMKQLPSEIKHEFDSGNFAAKLTEGRFNSVWMDYALETTENKELKGGGGIIGLTLRGPSLVRWFLCRPVTAQYSTRFKFDVCGSKNNPSKHIHREMKYAHTKKWNKHVSDICNMFDGSYVDPFDLSDPPEKLVNISTGVIAAPQIQESLLGALDKGERMAERFVTESLCSNDPASSKSFYAPIQRAGILTMTQMRKKLKLSGKAVSLDGQQLYMRLLATNSQKHVPLSRVMSFENAPIAQSLFTDEGMINTCTKSDFMHKLEEHVVDRIVMSVDFCDALIIDGHALIQAMPFSKNSTCDTTFGQLAAQYLCRVMSMAKGVGCTSGQIHNVFDKYLKDSIKSQTRSRRGADHTGSDYQVRPEIRVPANWKQFLSVGENKSRLAECFKKHMIDNAHHHLEPSQTLYVGSSKDDVTTFVSKSMKETDVPALKSNHEEADTRLILHAIHAASGGVGRIVISSPDTDVLVLLVHHRALINARQIYFFTGHQGKHVDRTRFIPVHDIYNQLTNPQRKVMLSCYCVSGCDTVSALFGQGKKKAYRIMMNNADDLSAMGKLGSITSLSPSSLAAARRFVGAMYGVPGCKSLNDVRESMAAAKRFSPRRLPPTEDAFQLHVLRASYQLFIWCNANEANTELPDPREFGYERHSITGNLQPTIMNQSPAAPELLNDIICRCLPCTEQCTCYKNSQPCTTACDCGYSITVDSDLDDENLCRNPILYEEDTDTDNEYTDKEEEED